MIEQQPVSAKQIETISNKTYAEALADDWTTLLRAIDERNAQLQLHREALRWALENGVSLSGDRKVLYDGGCGCCVDTIEPPAHLRAVLAEVTGEK